MRKITLNRAAAVNAAELLEALQDMLAVLDEKTVYVTINSDSIRLQLVEETLTDGSKVYTIELNEATK